MKKELKRYKNLLIMKPVRQHRWRFEEKDESTSVIYFPRFESKLGKKLGEIYKMKPYRRIYLDEYGTAVWKLCNGRVTVREIGEVISEQFGDKVEPLYPRLSEFLNILERNKLIKFRQQKKPGKKSEA